MATETNIEWADGTFNPWIGCTKVSPACDHCYAAVATPSRTLGVEWGAGKPRHRTSAANWALPIRWNRADFRQCGDCGWRGDVDTLASDQCPACGKHEQLNPARRRVFCASLADVFDNEVDPQWRADLFALIRATPNLDWLLLTKRIGNVRNILKAHHAISGCFGEDSIGLRDWIENWLNDIPPANVWIGATICNQAEADRDVPKLLRVPAAVRFLSIEPMLGPVDLRWAFPDIRTACCHRCGFRTNAVGGTCPNDGETLRGDVGIYWIIAGGESGSHARPSRPDWFRSLRDQCAAARVAFMFKQWGEWLPDNQNTAMSGPHDPSGAIRVGKKIAGRMLDGVTHDGYPEVRHA